MTITKASLINSICNNANFPKQESSALVESLVEIIKSTLVSGEDVLVSGFGKFCLKDKKERGGRNPETGGDMKLRARRVVIFKLSGKLKEKFKTTK
jgi:integration host factor subunit alpha